jgi:hypothetical protein
MIELRDPTIKSSIIGHSIINSGAGSEPHARDHIDHEGHQQDQNAELLRSGRHHGAGGCSL